MKHKLFKTHLANKSETPLKKQYCPKVKSDFAASLEDTVYGAPGKMHTSAAKCVVTFASKNCPNRNVLTKRNGAGCETSPNRFLEAGGSDPGRTNASREKKRLGVALATCRPGLLEQFL